MTAFSSLALLKTRYGSGVVFAVEQLLEALLRDELSAQQALRQALAQAWAHCDQGEALTEVDQSDLATASAAMAALCENFEGLFGPLAQLQGQPAQAYALVQSAQERRQDLFAQVRLRLLTVAASLDGVERLPSGEWQNGLGEEGDQTLVDRTLLNELATTPPETALSIDAEMASAEARELYQAARSLLVDLDLLHGVITPALAFTLYDESNIQRVTQLLEQFAQLALEQQQQAPALLNGLAKLTYAAGDFVRAEALFERVAASASGRLAQAEAHYNALQVALDLREWARAKEHLAAAISKDTLRFAPFPPSDYRLETLQEASATALLLRCSDLLHPGAVVTIKALTAAHLQVKVKALWPLLRQWQALELEGVVALQRFGVANVDADEAAPRLRPYLVLTEVDGQSLDQRLQRQGCLEIDQLLILAQRLAQVMRRLHEQGLLHGNLKPASVLLPADGDLAQAQLTDIALAFHGQTSSSAVALAQAGVRSLWTDALAETMIYSAPERLGRITGVTIGPPSDIYSFGKLCCVALFATADPYLSQWRSLPQGLAALLEACLEEEPERRPASFGVVLEQLSRAKQGDDVVSQLFGDEPTASADAPSLPPLIDDQRVAAAAQAAVAAKRQEVLAALGWRGRLRYRARRLARAVSSSRWGLQQAALLLLCVVLGAMAMMGYRAFTAPDVVRLEQVLRGHGDDVRTVAFEPSGQRLLSASKDGTARLWQLPGGQLDKTLRGHRYPLQLAQFNLDGRRLLTLAEREEVIQLWDTATGISLGTLAGHEANVRYGTFGPNDDRVATASNDLTARLWSLDGEPLFVFKGHEEAVLHLAFAPDGRRLATASADTTVRLWRLDNGQLLATLAGHLGWVNVVAFSPDGRWLISGSSDRTARLWPLDAEAPPMVLRGHTGPIFAVAVDITSRRLATASEDHTIRLWRLRQQGELEHLLLEHTAAVTSIDFSPNGRYLVSSSLDNTVRLWDVERGVLLKTLTQHSDAVLQVRFAPNSLRFATASADSTLQLWEIALD